MTMKRSRCIPVVVLCGLIFLGVMVGPALVQAAPQTQAVSFGLLMKPGWGGSGDSYGVSFGNIYILKCAYLKGKAPHLSTNAPVQAGQVITGWGRWAGCATRLAPFEGGAPVPDGYQLPR